MTDINVASFDTQIAALLPDAEASESKAYSEASAGQREMLKNNIAQAYSHFGNSTEHMNASKTTKANIAGLTAQKAVAQKEAAAAAERDEEKTAKAKLEQETKVAQDAQSSLKILDPESKTPVDAGLKAKATGTVSSTGTATVAAGTTETKSATSSKKAD